MTSGATIPSHFSHQAGSQYLPGMVTRPPLAMGGRVAALVPHVHIEAEKTLFRCYQMGKTDGIPSVNA